MQKNPVKKTKQLLDTSANPLSDVADGLTLDPPEKNHNVIYETVMRGGGEPFGRPYGMGLTTLTEKIVKYFKLSSFFGFETLEQPVQKNATNKFTLYGASRYHGQYDLPAAKEAHLKKDSPLVKTQKKKAWFW